MKKYYDTPSNKFLLDNKTLYKTFLRIVICPHSGTSILAQNSSKTEYSFPSLILFHTSNLIARISLSKDCNILHRIYHFFLVNKSITYSKLYQNSWLLEYARYEFKPVNLFSFPYKNFTVQSS